MTKLAAHEAELGGTPAEREAAITRMQARQRGKLERKQTEERVGQGEMAGQKRSKKVAEQDVAAQRMQARVRGGADRKVVEERKAAGDLPGQPRLSDDYQGHAADQQGVEAEAMAAAIAEADARAAAVMQARARGERDRKEVQARQQEGSLPGQQLQQPAAVAEPADEPSWVAKLEQLGGSDDGPAVTEAELDVAPAGADRPTGGGESKAAAEARAPDAVEAEAGAAEAEVAEAVEVVEEGGGRHRLRRSSRIFEEGGTAEAAVEKVRAVEAVEAAEAAEAAAAEVEVVEEGGGRHRLRRSSRIFEEGGTAEAAAEEVRAVEAAVEEGGGVGGAAAAAVEMVEEAVQAAVQRALQMAVQMTVDTSWLADAKAAEAKAAEVTVSVDAAGQARVSIDAAGQATASAEAASLAAEAAVSAEADAKAAAVMQARARGERDRKAVQARQQEGSLPGQQRQQQELQQETDEKVAVVRADVQQLKEAHLDLRPLAGAAAQQMLSPRMEQLLSPKGIQWVQQHMQTRCCGSRGKLPKNSKLPRLPLPGGALQGGSGLFGTPLLSSLMLEYGDWVQRYS